MRGVFNARQIIIIVCVVLCAISCIRIPISRTNKTINPLQFGLKEASTGVERYYVLQKTHKEAVKLGIGVSYAGIKEIILDIPFDAKPIPLTFYTDFAGVTLNVKNTQKNLCLFSLSDKMTPVEVEGGEIDNKDFSQNTILKAGRKLLVISDKTPWVENRIGPERS